MAKCTVISYRKQETVFFLWHVTNASSHFVFKVKQIIDFLLKFKQIMAKSEKIMDFLLKVKQIMDFFY